MLARKPSGRDIQRHAHNLMRSKARTFFLASLFLPPHTRRDVEIVYAYFRTIDDLVDERFPGWNKDVALRRITSWEEGLSGLGGCNLPLLHPLLELADRYAIPQSHLQMILEGARFDLNMQTIETRMDLRHYSILVAGSVGMVMARLLGDARGLGEIAACDLGVAMQLTNILRDVGDDLARGRIYLPIEDLRNAGCSVESLRAGQISAPFRAVVQELMQEARSLYRSGVDGIRYLDHAGQFSIYLAASLYERILDKIERQSFDVFTQRAHLTMMEKWKLAVPAYRHHRQLQRR